MTPRFSIYLAVCVVATFASTSIGQIVRSGSNGSLGALIATNTGEVLIPLPPDGKLHYTSVLIGDQTIVRFGRNALNTPVFLLATSNVVIQGLIDVSGTDGGDNMVGSGGPGGFDGGTWGIGGPPGDGEGPGGGTGGYYDDTNRLSGAGSFATRGSHRSGPVYGNRTLNPLIGGSGGGGMGDDPTTSNVEKGGGGGGGGAILVASDIRIEFTGRIFANGGIGYLLNRFGYGGGGSGGAVRLVAPQLMGNGYVDVAGRYSGVVPRYGSGEGRIRIDAASSTSLQLYGIVRFGGDLDVFSSVIPSLRIVEVAGQVIPESAGSTVQISLSRSASTNQTVKLRAKDFSGFVPITIAVNPEQGPSSRFVGEIKMGTTNVAEGIISVILTPGTVNRIQAWTQ